MRRYVINKKVGKKIRLERRRKKLTQEDLADKVGIHESTLGRIERGESNPPLQTIERISRAIGVKTKKFF